MTPQDEARIIALKTEGTLLRLKADYEGVHRISDQLKALFPEHSIGYTINLNTLVTRLSWDSQQQHYDQIILDDAEKTLSLCRAQIKAKPKDYDGYYYCGQAHFALTYLHALRGNYYRAGKNGSDTIETLEQTLALNPDLIDAKMHLGVAYYYADNLPPFIKAFSRFLWFVPTGNSERSLPYIKEAFAWDAGGVPDDWQSVTGWHKDVISSHGIRPTSGEDDAAITRQFEKAVAREPRLAALLEHHWPFYEKLLAVSGPRLESG